MRHAQVTRTALVFSLFISLTLSACQRGPSKTSVAIPPTVDVNDSTAAPPQESGKTSPAADVGESTTPAERPSGEATVEEFKGPPPEHSGGLLSLDSATGCGLEGPVDGELLGESLGEPSDFSVAAARCMKAKEKCVGVTSQWYLGMPWVPVGPADPFRRDEMSYARTFLRRCPETKPSSDE